LKVLADATTCENAVDLPFLGVDVLDQLSLLQEEQDSAQQSGQMYRERSLYRRETP
jgi:hypothetical protein